MYKRQQEHVAWIYFGGGQELWDELYAGFGLKPLLAGSGGSNVGGWFTKEILSLADFKGLRIRMPGLGGEVMARLGAVPVNLPGAEILPALQTGAIDAADWIAPYNDLAFGFHKVADFYDEEIDATVEQLASLIEPIMIMVIGVIVGVIVVALSLIHI